LEQLWVEVEESPNSGYLPMRVFEARGPIREASSLIVGALQSEAGQERVIGWSSDDGGSPVPVQYAEVTDSGSAVSLLIAGGDYGVRIRDAVLKGPWRLSNESERGEPYLLLPVDAVIAEA
jgi:hypothetical protein